MLGLGDKEVSAQEQLWQSMLQQYDYQTTDEFDLAIARSVETGYIDEEIFHKEADKLNKQVHAAKSESSFGEAWHLYHDSFDDNESEVCKTLVESFKTNCKYISPMNLDGTVRLLRDLGRSEQADELIDFYIMNRKDSPKLFDLDEYAFAEDIRDRTIISKFKAATLVTKEQKTLREVLAKISEQNGWGSNDAEVLFNATEDEYYSLFRSEKGRYLSQWVNTCLKFGRFSNASEREKKIADTATNALKKIAKENKINARRVSKYGINLEE
jgi:chorismate mutase